MKNFKKAFFAIVCAIAFSSTYQAVGQNNATPKTFELNTPFEVKPVIFQEWYAGIEVGGTGINVFIPISNVQGDVTFNEVYFRNLKGELILDDNEYVAVLKNPSKLYTFKKAEKPADYPFDLKDNECVLSYTRNGETKYHKIVSLNEVAGTYYKDGPPSIYSREGMASVDEEENN